MTAPNRLERVIRDLERDPHLPRVKKLLYCACYGVWEDSSDRLNQVTLEDLVQGVWERSPTLEALQFQLNRVVKTLNKPVEYAHVANGVLRILSQLYRDTYDITRPVARPLNYGLPHLPSQPLPPVIPPAVASAAPPATQIRYGSATAEEAPAQTQWFLGNAGPVSAAQRSAEAAVEAHVLQALAHHPESHRLKKLLICVCKNFWENDQSRLLAVDWRALLQETRQLIPTLENLDYVLQAIVKSLSKPVEYLRVAHLLLDILTPVYEQHQPDETQFFAGGGPAIAMPDPGGIGHRPDDGIEPPTGLFKAGLSANSLDERYPPKPLPEAATPVAAGRNGDATAATTPGLLNGLNSGVNSIDDGESEAFALSLELMRYANPLMAKIVAFSALHRLFRFSEQDWTELRHQGLAELLMALQQRYPNFTDLEVNLCAIAEQLEIADKAMQTTAAILKVMKPRYDRAPQAPARALGRRDGPIPAQAGEAMPNGAGAAIASPAQPSERFAEPAAKRASPAPVPPVAIVAEPEDSLEADLARLAAALEDDDLPLPFKS